MARARNIKPSFFQNEQIGELPPLARLLFIGMWTIADFKGCIEYRPKRLKIQLLPYDDDADIDALTKNLEDSGFIVSYSVSSQRYIKIINFEKHQNPHKNEKEAGSEIPDAPEIPNKTIALENIEKNPEQDGTAPADSLIPLTDSLKLAESQKRDSQSRKITLKTWLAKIKANGEKAISDYQPVWEYAKRVGLPDDWIQIAWIKFVERYRDNPNHNRKQYIDWRRAFLDHVEKNYLKLWAARDDGQYYLTTVGVQAEVETREAA